MRKEGDHDNENTACTSDSTEIRKMENNDSNIKRTAKNEAKSNRGCIVVDDDDDKRGRGE